MGNVTGWRNSSRYSKFPFSEASSLRALSGWIMPGGVFDDAQIRLPFGTRDVYLKSLSWSGGGLRGVISTESVETGSFFFTPEDLDNGTAEIVDLSGKACGTIVTGESARDELRSMPAAVQDFETEAGFEVTTLFLYPKQALRFVRVGDVEYSGRIVLVEGPGITLVREGPSQVRFDAIGDPESLAGCSRAPDGQALKTINSVVPNPFGDFGIEPGDYDTPETSDALRQVLKITSGSNSLTFSLAR